MYVSQFLQEKTDHDKDQLKVICNSNKLFHFKWQLVGGDGLIERTERSDRSVIFYADHIPVDAANPLCFEFEAVCEIVVGNLQHAAVHVYDYYDPGWFLECKANVS